MASVPKILAFAGSLRKDSHNKKLVQIAAAAARNAGAAVTVLDLRELSLPVYDADLEAQKGLPANARKLKELMLAHQGLLMSCPEYNSSVTGAWKNTIDWASRPAPGEGPLAAFNGKVAAILSASPGALGGLRGLVHVRAILSNINVLVLPEQLAIPKAHEAFAEDGSLKDAQQQTTVQRIAERLVAVLKKLIT
ncbi:MAG: NAD(P)H-dependent oxidoreductase [Planctomycetes bacterium]|nr:NAD(P)H-dependent oxidoreductase [Planctomycetota bacterium]